MNKYEILPMIEDKLPAVYRELKRASALGDTIQIMKILVNYSKRMLFLHNLPMVIKCIRIVGKIYDHGNVHVRNSIENVFVFSFSSLQANCQRVEWNIVQAKIPISLYSIYIQQIYKSGI